MSGRSNALSEAELISQADADLGAGEHESLLDALEAFYGAGCSDAQAGEAEYADGHVYRVHRWLVWTDNYGFHTVSEFDSEDEAQAEVERYEKELEDAEDAEP